MIFLERETLCHFGSKDKKKVVQMNEMKMPTKSYA